MRKLLNMRKLGMDDELGCKRALKTWEVFQTRLDNSRNKHVLPSESQFKLKKFLVASNYFT